MRFQLLVLILPFAATITFAQVPDDALQRAEESPLPDPSTLRDGVFATPEDLDTPHHK